MRGEYAMTAQVWDERAWDRADDPMAMLGLLCPPRGNLSGEPSNRKLRLFSVAVARAAGERYWACDPEGFAALAVAERFADGFEWEWPACDVFDPVAWHGANWMARVDLPGLPVGAAVRAAILRDIFGNPFRNLAAFLDRRWEQWRAWNDGVVRKLAQAIYPGRGHQGEWDMMPYLGDALEEAGCDHAVLLRHFRGQEPCPHRAPAPETPLVDFEYFESACKLCGATGWRPLRVGHVLGCHALDLALGKG